MTALDIATELIETPFESTRIEAAAMLRKQDAAIKQLREALWCAKRHLKVDSQVFEIAEAALEATEELK